MSRTRRSRSAACCSCCSPAEHAPAHRAAACGGCTEERIGALPMELRSSAALRCSLSAGAGVRERIPAALAGERVDRAVATLTGLSRTAVAELVAAGDVRLGGRAVNTRSRRVVDGALLQGALTETAHAE